MIIIINLNRLFERIFVENLYAWLENNAVYNTEEYVYAWHVSHVSISAYIMVSVNG